MGKRVFVSYSHQQGEWVWQRLIPCLRAGGAEPLVDRERFVAGRAVVGQMDRTQDQAQAHVLVLSPAYLKSPYCTHEMRRAVDTDPDFKKGTVIPVMREACTLPRRIKTPSPLYVNLQNDRDAAQWQALLAACQADLGISAPDWLSARDQVQRYLDRNQSVNLVVQGNPKWQQLFAHLQAEAFPALGVVDLESGAVASRRALVREVLQACGAPASVPASGDEDLVTLHQALSAKSGSLLGLWHVDVLPHRPYYDVPLFAALRHLMMTEKKLLLLAQSRLPFAALLPPDHPLSSIMIHTVELLGRP